MYPGLTPQNASQIVQEATQRLQVIDSAIKTKQAEKEKIEKQVADSNTELETVTKELERTRGLVVGAKNDLAGVEKEIDTMKQKEQTLSAELVDRLKKLYDEVLKAKELLLQTVTQGVDEQEKLARATIDTLQEKKRLLAELEKEIEVVNTDLVEKKKNAFNIQKKADELYEKEQYIKKKYDDAGISYT